MSRPASFGDRFTDTWHGREAELREAGDEPTREWSEGWTAGDPDRLNTFIGEAVGMIRTIESAGVVIERMSAEAETLLRGGSNTLVHPRP